MNPTIQLIMSLVPTIIQDIKDAHAAANPTAPPLTSEGVMAAMEQVFTDDVLKDEALKVALHAELGD